MTNPTLRKVKPIEYTKWLFNYVHAGNMPTHYYTYSVNYGIRQLFMANKSFDSVPLYGAEAVSIIIPKSIEVGGDYGHNQMFFEEFDKTERSVPIYQDQLNYFKARNIELYKSLLREFEHERLENLKWEQEQNQLLNTISKEKGLFLNLLKKINIKK
jgi:hypothetical protein